MSGWTILTIRPRNDCDYTGHQSDSQFPWYSIADIVASMEADSRIRTWTTWANHIYAYVDCGRYQFNYALDLVKDYRKMVRDFVILGANDTTDYGHVKYYTSPSTLEFEYKEDQGQDVPGYVAMSKIISKYGILVRDPFHHNRVSSVEDQYLKDGAVKVENAKIDVIRDV